MPDVTIFHNPACGTSRNTLALIRHAGIEPTVFEYLKTPPSKARLRELLSAMGIPARELLREKGTPYAELGLGDPKWSDDQLLDFIGRHPILMNRPVVETPLGVALCRPSETVLELLPVGALPPFTKEDGEVVHDNGVRRARTSLRIRPATPDDAPAVLAIYAPIVRETAISFELEPPDAMEMRARIERALRWLVSEDAAGAVNGYAYAGKHRDRAAYQWAVDVTVYVREDFRGRNVGKALYARLFEQLTAAGYCQAFAGIALPNAGSVALHESVGFAPAGVYRNVGFKHGCWHDVGWWQKELQRPDVPDAPR